MKTILLCCILCTVLAARAAGLTDTLSYHFEPHVQKGKLRIAVKVKYPTLLPQRIGPLQDFYGTPDMDRCVSQLTAEVGCRIDTAGGKKVIHPAKGIIAFRYEVLLDSSVLEQYSFAPSVGSTFFHLSGCNWLLPVGEDTVRHTYHFTAGKLLPGWHYYHSANRRLTSFYREGSYEDAGMLVWGGSLHPPYTFNALGKPVEVYLDNASLRKDSTTFHQTARLFHTMRQWFQDSSQAFFLVPILQRQGILAGNALDNMFRCFIRPDVRKEELLLLLAHELFHQWLPGTIRLAAPRGEPGMKHEWFSEGFTDYCSWKILREARILSEQAFVQQLNQAITNDEDNPFKNKTLQELVAIGRAGSHGSALKKLSYYRGALIALQWDEALKATAGNRSLDEFLQELYRYAAARNGAALSEAEFFAFCSNFGLPADSSVARYIIRGETIDLPAAVSGGYKKQWVTVPAFQLGFDAAASFRSRTLTGVEPGSSAWKAGLRHGQPFTKISNSSRFINGWRREEPVSITVRIDNREKTIRYWPFGPARRQARYVKQRSLKK